MHSLAGRNLGVYRLIEQVGAGGMAVVYKAHDPALDRHVAIKILPHYLGHDPEFSRRFLNEARNVARLRHPNILPIYSYGEEDGLNYFVTDLVEGGTLRDLMGIPMDPVHAVLIIEQIAAALQYAHGKGIVHRDVKPANVLMSEPYWPQLSDFGIARVLEENANLTQTGGHLGTPHYMAPEQARGEPVSPKTDQYALGIVLYEILTGTPPFRADTPQAVVYQHIYASLPPPQERNPDISDELEQVILTALAKGPVDRFPDMAAFAAAMRAAVQELGPPIQSRAAPLHAGSGAGPSTSNGLSSSGRAASFHTERISRPPDTDAMQPVADTGAERKTGTAGFGPTVSRAPRTALSGWPVLAGSAAVLLVALAGLVFYLLHAPSNKHAAPNVPRSKVFAPWGSADVGTELAEPSYAVAVDSRFNIYLTAANSNHIEEVSPTGKELARWRFGGTRDPSIRLYGIAVDTQGNLYVADTDHSRIQKVSPTKRVLGSWGSFGTGRGQFRVPRGLALDGRGNIYVADTLNSRVEKLSPTGTFLAAWGTEGTKPGQFDQPDAVAVDRQGNIYVVESGNNRVQKLSPDGRPLAHWGGFGSAPGEFDRPAGVAVDARGDIYVADALNGRIQKLSPQGQPLAQWGRPRWRLAFPTGISVDGRGSVYVADPGSVRLQKFSSQGNPLPLSGAAGSQPGQLKSPYGIAVDARGNVYVADRGNDRVQKFSPTGRALASWGKKGRGPGEFMRPNGLAIDARGNIYVADGLNSRVQELSPQGRPVRQCGRATMSLTVPAGVAVDSRGDMYVADFFGNHVLKLSSGCKVLGTWGKGFGSGSGQFENPLSVAVDAHGVLYIADAGNGEVQRISPIGQFLRPWGRRGTRPGEFQEPRSIALDSSGDLYVADTLNNRIQELSASGKPVAAWGSKGSGPGQFLRPYGVAVDAVGDVYATDSFNNRIQRLSAGG